MKFTHEQSASHAAQGGSHKNTDGSASFHRTMPMGDCPSNSNCCDRTTDSVSCWGDAPKRPTRFIDQFEENNREVASSISHKQTRKAVKERSSNSQNTTVTDRKKSSEQGNTSSLSSEEKDSKTTNGTAGRERLLEWLRNSQAKRDENNRQVFTRWIDKLESMNNPAMGVASFNQATTSMLESMNAMDYQSIYPFASSLSGTLTAPTFWVGNPIGMLSTAAIQNNCSNLKVPVVLPMNMSNIYMPYTTRTPISNFQFAQTQSTHQFTMSDNSTDTCNTNLITTQQYSPENIQAGLLPQTCLTLSHMTTHHCDDEVKCRPDSPLACDSSKLAEVVNGDAVAQATMKLGGQYLTSTYPSLTPDQSLITGGCYPQPMYITASTIGDPSCPQIVCYCYLPTTGQPTQPMIYLVQPNGAYPSCCALDGSTLGTSVQLYGEQITQQGSSNLGHKVHPSEQTNDSYTSTMSYPDDLCAAKTHFPTLETPVNQKQLSPDEGLDTYNKPQPIIDFEFQKWYSMLNDITQTSMGTKQPG